ncbi:hypothetical protein E3P77_01048 [Wallemia ichthyophaga]|nr:hypothetical protein E3P98_01239 [Wallemia ichthyophaga]TIB68615.1 hypothetical protein E3P77_01048 [Wallemia ichthyophaga]
MFRSQFGLIGKAAKSASLFKTQQSRLYASGALSKNDIQSRIFDVLKSFDKVKGENLTEQASFTNDLGLDSLDAVEVVMAIEEEFAIEIPDAEADAIQNPCFHCMPDDYSFKPTKGLKFKNDSGLKRKKKSSAQTAPKDNAIGPSGSGDSPHTTRSTQDTRTESEIKFDHIQRQRLHHKVKNNAKLSHKDKVDEFNKKLENLTEHNDLPKIGPG